MKIRKTPKDGYEKFVDSVWLSISEDEYNNLLKDGAEVVAYDVPDYVSFVKSHNLCKEFRDLEKDAHEITSKMVDGKATLEDVNKYADIIRRQEEIMRTMSDDYTALTGEKLESPDNIKEVILSESEDSAPEENPEQDPVPEEPQESEEPDTIASFYAYVSDKQNPLDLALLDFVKDKDAFTEEVIGGQVFKAYTLYLATGDKNSIAVKVLILLDKATDKAVVLVPEGWQDVVELEGEIDYEELNNDLVCQAIVSEELVIEDPDKFYEEVGNVYGIGSGYQDMKDVADIKPPVGSNSDEEPIDDSERTPDDSDLPMPADITSVDTPAMFDFESTVVRYKVSLKESWLKGFTTTENFKKKVNEYIQKLDKYLKKSLRECVSVVLGSTDNFIAVRVNKGDILSSSLSTDWYKKRLNKACEAIKKYATDLRIVETYGSYYTRTFLLVEATDQNYVLDADQMLPEIEMNNGKTIYESEEVSLSEDFINALNIELSKDVNFIVRPVSKEHMNHYNSGKKAYCVKVNEEAPKVVFISEDIELMKQTLAEDSEPVPTEPKDNEEAPSTEPVTEPKDNEEVTVTKDPVASDDADPVVKVGVSIEKIYTLSKEAYDALPATEYVDEDTVRGIRVVTKFIDIINNNQEVIGKILYCKVFGKPAIVLGKYLYNMLKSGGSSDCCGPETVITDLEGNIISCGIDADNFLRKLVLKYSM